MMQMNSGIILAGQQPDIMGQMQRGYQMGRQNAFAQLAQQHGPGLVSGDQSAMNAFAQFDPQFAMQARQTQLGMENTQQIMAMRAAEFARSVSAAEAAAEAEKIRRGVQAASAARTPEQWDAIAQQYGLTDYVGQFENRESILRSFLTMAEVMEREKGAKRNVVNVDGVLYEVPETGDVIPLTEPRDRAPLVQIGMGGDQTPGAALPGAPEANVPAGSGRSAFGATGAVGNVVNAVTDFFAGREVFQNIGENTRFFRNLEEDLLVGLSQAYGRQPAQQLMERLRSLLPNVGTTEGAQAAYREVAVMRERFERDLNVLTQQAKRRMSDTQRQEVEARILGIQSALSQMDEALRRLDPNPSGSATEISPEARELMDLYTNE